MNGSLGYWQQPSHWGRNETGNWEEWTFHGSKAQVQALASAYSTLYGLTYEVQESYGQAQLVVRFPWNADGFINPSTDLITNWEFFAQKAEKDLLEADDNGGLVRSILAAQKETIRNKILNPPDGTTIAPVQQSDFAVGGAGPTDTSTINAFALYTLMQAGMKSYLMPAPVLRRTIITSNQYALGYTLLNVKKLLSTHYLLFNENVPTSLLFNINNYVGSDSTTDPNLVYGWYKEFPTFQQIALLKWQIVQEWQYGWWPKIVYGLPLT